MYLEKIDLDNLKLVRIDVKNYSYFCVLRKTSIKTYGYDIARFHYRKRILELNKTIKEEDKKRQNELIQRLKEEGLIFEVKY